MAHQPPRNDDANVVVEAFGTFARRESVHIAEGTVWSLFLSRAEMMGWSVTSETGGAPPTGARGRSALWSVHEAELSDDRDSSDSGRLAWAQIGVAAGVPVAVALPSVGECLHDTLRRFGRVEISGLQFTVSSMRRGGGSSLRRLVQWLAWFSTTSGPPAVAFIATDQDMLGGRDGTRWASQLGEVAGTLFRFEWVTGTPAHFAIRPPADAPTAGGLASARPGVKVLLPEWSVAAAIWAVALVIDSALAEAPDTSDFAVRITRLG
ncbi:MAG: hypothetical protein R3B59_10760 [Dehalococcoidia bacterium]